MTKPTTTKLILVVLYLIALHTNIDLIYHGKLLCTNFLAGVVGLTLLALNRQRIVRRDINLVSIIPLIGVLSIIISPEAETLWPHGIRTLAQLTYSVVMAYSIYLELSHWPVPAVARLFGTALAVVTVGCVLEVHTPVKLCSDTYRKSSTTRT